MGEFGNKLRHQKATQFVLTGQIPGSAMIKISKIISHQNQKCYNRFATIAAIVAVVEVYLKDSIKNA